MGILQHIEHQITALNDLIRINNDRITGYRKQMETAKEEDLQALFSKYIAQSQDNITELADYVHILGGSPAEGTSLSGKIFHACTGVRSVFTKADRQAVLDYCESTEDMIKTAYRNALDDKELIWEDKKVVSMLSSQYDSLKKSNLLVKDLSDDQIAIK